VLRRQQNNKKWAGVRSQIQLVLQRYILQILCLLIVSQSGSVAAHSSHQSTVLILLSFLLFADRLLQLGCIRKSTAHQKFEVSRRSETGCYRCHSEIARSVILTFATLLVDHYSANVSLGPSTTSNASFAEDKAAGQSKLGVKMRPGKTATAR
jgi:hypothetical protein